MKRLVLVFLIHVVVCWHSFDFAIKSQTDIGHAIILQIGLNQVDTYRQTRIREFLTSLQKNHLNLTDVYSSACWADAIKKTDEYRESWKWHVVDFGRIRSFVSKEENVINKIDSLVKAIDLVQRKDQNFRNLRFLVHIAADLHQPFHTFQKDDYGSNIHVQFDSVKENLHFFTDRTAGALLNPYQLPLSPEMEAYVRRKAIEIGQLCENEGEAFSSSLLLQWANQSNNKARQILQLVENGLSEESVNEIQQILLHQMCIGGKHLGMILHSLPLSEAKGFRVVLFIILCTLIVFIFTRSSQKWEDEIPLLH